MRKISRSKETPNVLLSGKAISGKKEIFNYLRQSPEYRSQRRDNIDESFFYSHELKATLAEEFQGKCPFCESSIQNESAVLHFRPLRFPEKNNSLFSEYYLWLAYEWRNIFISCPECNIHKGNEFPVTGTRANYLASYQETCEHENSLLLDPSVDDPKKHLKFMLDGSVIGLTDKGNETIDVFSLNRENLLQRRKKAIDKFISSLEYIAIDKSDEIISASILETNFPGVIESIARDIASVWHDFGGPRVRYSKKFLINFIEELASSVSAQRDIFIKAYKYFTTQDKNQPYQIIYDEIAYSLINSNSALNHLPQGNVNDIHIKNFKAISDLHISVPKIREHRSGTPCLMILGENSTGKTSLLSAIALSLLGSEESKKLKKYFPDLIRSHDASRLDQLDKDNITVNIHLDNNDNACKFNYKSQYDILEDSRGIPLVLAYGPRRYFNPKKEHYASGSASRVKTLFNPLETIPDPTKWLSTINGQKFNTVAAALRIILSLNDNDEIIRDSNQLAVRANGRVTPIHALSEGYKSLFIMSVDIMRELLRHGDNLEIAQAVVLIDEIETHLHPRWKMRIMSSLRLAFPKVQFIVTTHDPLCLRGMDNREVVVLDRDTEANIYALDDLPDIQGMTVEQLLISDYFGLSSTTDPDIEFNLASLAGDVVAKNHNDVYRTRLSERSREKLSRITLGDSVSEQIISDAISQYLIQRQSRDEKSRTLLRKNVVNAVIDTLRKVRG